MSCFKFAPKLITVAFRKCDTHFAQNASFQNYILYIMSKSGGWWNLYLPKLPKPSCPQKAVAEKEEAALARFVVVPVPWCPCVLFQTGCAQQCNEIRALSCTALASEQPPSSDPHPAHTLMVSASQTSVCPFESVFYHDMARREFCKTSPTKTILDILFS